MTAASSIGAGSAIDRATDWLAAWWWYRLPMLAGRISRPLSLAFADGLYLVAWPRAAALGPPLALLLGLVAGWQRFGAEQVFTQSAMIVALAIVLGFWSSQLGIMFVLGFALVDFFLYDNPALQVRDPVVALRLRLALLVVYAVLATLALLLPLSIRLLRAATPLPPPRLADLRLAVEAAFGGIAGGGLLFLYLQAVPLLVRPLFTWRGRQPPLDAITLIQQHGWLFALLGAAIVVGRVLTEYTAAAIAPEAVEGLADSVQHTERPGLLDRLPWAPQVGLWSAAETLLLAGLLDSPASALTLFVGLFAIGAARSLLATHAGVWNRMMGKVPVVLRLLVALAATYAGSTWLLSRTRFGESFEPLIWVLLLSWLLTALIFPGPARPAATAAPGGQRG